MAKYIVTGDNVILYMKDADGVVKTVSGMISKGDILDIGGTSGDPNGTQFITFTEDPNTWIIADMAIPYVGPIAPIPLATIKKTFFTTPVKWGIGIGSLIIVILVVVYFVKKSNKNKK